MMFQQRQGAVKQERTNIINKICSMFIGDKALVKELGEQSRVWHGVGCDVNEGSTSTHELGVLQLFPFYR